jgi:biopolymer transport protein ExbD
VDFIREARRAKDLNLTPLVDVILMLVIFFMISTSFVASESMELSLPEKGTTESVAGDVTRILILPTGELLVNEKPMDGNTLNAYLAQLLAGDVKAKIAIFTTPGVSVQQLVAVMDTVYLTGGTNVQVDKLDQVL